jgi:hypothetical protein
LGWLKNVVNTSRGPNSGVGGGQCGCVYMIFLIAASFRVFQKPETKNWLVSGIWRKSESKNHQFQVFQNPQRTISSRYFKTLKEPSVPGISKPSKNHQVS